jgi:hypothetical protein
VSTRILKIERTGDAWAKKLKPKIRLCGKWLEGAGFIPGERVELVITGPGTLTLRCIPNVSTTEEMP